MEQDVRCSVLVHAPDKQYTCEFSLSLTKEEIWQHLAKNHPELTHPDCKLAIHINTKEMRNGDTLKDHGAEDGKWITLKLQRTGLVGGMQAGAMATQDTPEEQKVSKLPKYLELSPFTSDHNHENNVSRDFSVGILLPRTGDTIHLVPKASPLYAYDFPASIQEGIMMVVKRLLRKNRLNDQPSLETDQYVQSLSESIMECKSTWEWTLDVPREPTDDEWRAWFRCAMEQYGWC
jgi:hypothetical protein